VSNAGISKAASIEDHTIEDFDKLFATNVRSPFFLVKELLPLFGEDRTSFWSRLLRRVLHQAIQDSRDTIPSRLCGHKGSD